MKFILCSFLSLVNIQYGNSAFTITSPRVIINKEQERQPWTRSTALKRSSSTQSSSSSTSLLLRTRNKKTRGDDCIIKLFAEDSDSNNSSSSSSSSNNSGGGGIQLVKNELIRPIRVDIVLGPRKRAYIVKIEANEEERKALAKRFRLSEIVKLEAEIQLMGDSSRHNNNGGYYGSGGGTIQAEGLIVATCTQTCVRTNEGFDVDLEFDFSTMVRPLISTAAMQQQQQLLEDEENAEPTTVVLGGMDISNFEGGGRKAKATNKRKNNKKGRRETKGMRGTSSGQTLDEYDIKQLQDLLKDIDMEDDVIEDESVWGSDGILDVGELVAQLFRLKLDPYPKKPGSEPVTYSITG